MSTNEDQILILKRRRDDCRAFLSQAVHEQNAPRLAGALTALRSLLADGQWHSWEAALAAMLRASDVAVKSADSQLRNAVTAGYVQRRGEYQRGTRRSPVQDMRQVRLIEWPISPLPGEDESRREA